MSPLFAQQWWFSALTDSVPGDTTLMQRIWRDYNGAGVRIGIYDSGVAYAHSDLQGTYHGENGIVINGQLVDGNVGPDISIRGYGHGTKVAGVIGADCGGEGLEGALGDGTGMLGVAWGSQLTGVNLFEPTSPAFISPANSAGFLSAVAQMTNFDVVNIRLRDSTYPSRGQSHALLESAAETGRDGLGTVIVNPAGNQGIDVSGFTPSRFTVTVGAVMPDGTLNPTSAFGSTILVSAPGGVHDVNSTNPGLEGYNDGFGWTSSAAAMLAGVVALMLEANPNLGWRDVNDILAATAFHTGSAVGEGPEGAEHESWFVNGANTWNGGGMHFSLDYGYGAVDAFAAVRMAEAFALIASPAKTSLNEASVTTGLRSPNAAFSSSSPLQYDLPMADNIVVEQVEIALTVTNPEISNLTITLISPEGRLHNTSVSLGDPLRTTGTQAWTVQLEAFRGELSQGTWRVVIEDPIAGDSGVLNSVRIIAYGSSVSPDEMFVLTNEYPEMLALDASRGTLSDLNGGSDWLNAAVVTGDVLIDLNPGAISTINGALLRVAAGSIIENAIAGDGSDRLIGNDVDNRLLGMRGDDVVSGGQGDDWLEGGDNNDALAGGANGDQLVGGSGADRLDGGAGNDTASYAASDAAVLVDLVAGTGSGGDAEGDTLVRIESLIGSNFADTLIGSAAANTVEGGAGDDTVIGGAGRDTLIGGEGADTFVFRAISETGVTIGPSDRISDFTSGIDRLDLAQIDANAAGGTANDTFTLIGAGQFSHAAGELRHFTSGANTIVAGDVNGDAVADFQIVLSGKPTLQPDDFLL